MFIVTEVKVKFLNNDKKESLTLQLLKHCLNSLLLSGLGKLQLLINFYLIHCTSYSLSNNFDFCFLLNEVKKFSIILLQCIDIKIISYCDYLI